MQLVQSALTKEKAIEVMKERGYSLVSSISRLTKEAGPDNVYVAISHPQLCFAKDTDLNVHLHATVDIDRSDISIEMIQLKLAITLNAQRFAFDHPLFEQIEQKMYNYAKACLEIDNTVETYKGGKKSEVVHSLREIPSSVGEFLEDKPKKEKKTIEERKKDFWENHVKPIAKQKGYTKAFALEFYEYWTEHKPEARKFRYENENYFDVAKRMGTFIRNNEKWSKTFVEKKAEKQDEQRKQKIKVIDKTKLFS